MKNVLKYSALSAVAIAAVATAPVGADASVTTAQPGFYDVANNKYYSAAQFKVLTKAEKVALLTSENVYLHLGASVGVVSAKDAAVAKNDTELAAKIVAADKFTAANLDAIHAGTTPPPVTGDLKVESVSAINGTVTVKFNRSPEVTPEGKDFAVTRSINGGTATTVVPVLNWNAATSTATLAVPQVATADVAQNVTFTAKYKEIPAQTASFTVAAASTTAKVDTVGYNANAAGTAHSVLVYFNSQVDETTAKTTSNYKLVAATGGNSITPSSVTLNTAPVGSYAAGQVATLSFSATNGLTVSTGYNLTVENVKSAGAVIPTTVVPFTTGTAILDAAVPTFSTAPALLNNLGAAIGATVVKGSELTLTATAEDANGTNVVSAQYRIVDANSNPVVNWTAVNALDGKFNTNSEQLTAQIKTDNLTAGQTYSVEVRAFDGVGKVTTTGTVSLPIAAVGNDVAAPTVTVPTVNYSATAVTGAAAQGAKTVRVAGTATDTHSIAGQAAKIASIEYRLREVNATTGAVTTTQTWTPATLATGHSYGTALVDYSFVTPTLELGKIYAIEVRTTDASGNVSATVLPTVTVASPNILAPVYATGVTGTPANAFQLGADTAIPTLSAVAITNATGPTTGASAAQATRQLGFEVTGTAADDLAVSRVEYSIERLVNGVPTLIKAYSNQGVSLTASTGAFTISETLPAVSGEYRINVVAYDGAGKSSVISTVSRFVDVTAPTATITAHTATAVKNDFLLTFNEAVTFTATNVEVKNASGVTIASSTVGATAPTVATGTITNSHVITIAEQYIQAGNTITLTGVADAAGNSVTSTYTFQASDIVQ